MSRRDFPPMPADMNLTPRLEAVFAQSLALRDAVADDRPFLLALHASTRAAELALTGWPPKTRQVFVQLQFDAQQADYLRRHPDAVPQVIESGGRAIGRLWIARAPDGLHVLDIALLPEHRGHGLGGACLRGVLATARDAQLAVHLHVAAGNPARRLYERLGFEAVGPSGLHQAMTWTPSPAARRPAFAMDFLEIGDAP